jgi:phage terminase large subunit GpA-like protein
MVTRLTQAETLYNDHYRKGLTPDPSIGISEWSDNNVVLSSKGSAAPGKYQTSRVPFTREIMDCLSPSHPCDHVVFMKPAQITGTQLILNWNGYSVAVCPGPFLIVEPTVDMAKKLSKQRLQEMIQDSPVLNGLIKPSREKDGGNTLLCKEYPGGVTILTGAGSASALRMMPVRNLALDEVDSYELDLDGEGDPIALAIKRTTTFGRRRKIFILSSPTEKDNSRIEREYLLSDQRRYNLPCPHCNYTQHLQWSGIKFEHDEKYKLKSEVTYVCEKCGCHIEERNKTDMLAGGRWIAENPDGRCPGFHINGLYSPLGWLSWEDITLEFLKFKKLKDEPLQKAWTNTVLAETWESKGATLEHSYLFNRREPVSDQINPDVVLLTCSVDVQDDRLECKVVGWQAGEECRVIEVKHFVGSPAKMLVWENLREYIQKTFSHENGLMRIVATTIDTGGHYTSETYEFVKSCDPTSVFAIKGSSTPGSPVSGKPSKQKNGVDLYLIGTDTIKNLLFGRLLIEEPGPGYVHFPDTLDAEYFKQLTAEKRKTVYVKGFKKDEWVKIRKRNEKLDLMVYNIAALYIIAFVVFPNLTISQILDSLRQKTPRPGVEPVVARKRKPRMLNRGEQIS